jgi:hypothetical protein
MSSNGGSEDLYINLIKNGIRAIRLGSKTPIEAKVGISLNKLKTLNVGMYEELLNDYKKVKTEWDLKQTK